MYKTKIVVWILVFILWISSMVVPGMFKSTTVTVSSDETQILRNLNKEKIAGNKLFASNNNSDIVITSAAIDGVQEDERFYSPIVGFAKSNNCAGFNDIGGCFSIIYVADFSKIFDGLLQDKKWNEVYSKAKEEAIVVYVDANSEKEIKDLMYLSFCNIYDQETAKQKTIQCWDKAYKIKSIDNMEDGAKEDNVFIVGPEYMYGASDIKNTMFKVNPEETVAKKLCVYIVSSLYEKDYLLEMLREEKFMKKSGLRLSSYNGIYNKGVLSSYDSATKITEVNVEWDGITVENSEELQEIIENIKQQTEEAPSENQEGSVISQETDEESDDKQTSSDAASGEWEINEKEENSMVEGNKEINPDAYGADDKGINISDFVWAMACIIIMMSLTLRVICIIFHNRH